MEWQTSLQPSALPSTVERRCDVSYLSPAWKSSDAVQDSVHSWSRLPGRDIASVLDNDTKPDSAYIYSTDPDHETEEDDCAAKESAVEAENVVQIIDAHFCVHYLY